MSRAVIIGAGPAGALLSIYLARQGYETVVYERRADLRQSRVEGGRSINLALATRGIVPLIDVGALEQVDAITIPMRGRMIHSPDESEPVMQPYGNHVHEVIHSVSRSELNAILLDLAEQTDGVQLEFNRQLADVDLDGRRIHFADGGTSDFDLLVGADGAGSVVRTALAEAGSCRHRTEWLDHDYKELTLPARPDGSHQLDPHALHIWPRGDLMVIALANPAGDFTVTLFAPRTTFAELTPDTVSDYFSDQFPDLARLIPDLGQQFADNPTGALGTLWADGWSHKDRAVLVGDAAHAIVPFHGQGMNAAMESVRALDRQLRAHPGDVETALHQFEAERKPNTDAIAQMALDNYLEMRSGVVDPNYLAKRNLALELEQRHPERIRPRYNMVMFSTMPYAEAQARAAQLNELLDTALNNPDADLDMLVEAIAALPPEDPLMDPNALSLA
jgi:kynurenine 3-monooxygenase